MLQSDKHTDGAAVGGSKRAAAGSKVAGAPLGSCRFVSMDATAEPSFSGGGGAERSVAPIDDGTGVAIVRTPTTVAEQLWHT